MKQRDTYVDTAKGICMLLIICIHTEVFSVVKMPLTFIAVPMFFFMSGFYDRAEKRLKEWLHKSLKTLILPAVIWTIFSTIYLTILQYFKTKEVSFNSFDIYNQSYYNGPVWFLYALLYAKILLWILKKICTQPQIRKSYKMPQFENTRLRATKNFKSRYSF